MKNRRLVLARAAVMAALCAGATGLVLAQQPSGAIAYETRSDFQRVTVWDTANGYRQLIFDARLDGFEPIQSEMKLSDPLLLTLSYSRHMMASVPLGGAGKPRRILVVGLGGACIQRYLHAKLPEATIDTAELDPVVVQVAKKYFNYATDARQTVWVGDGREFIEKSKNKYDVLMLDAFSATSIPYMLSTKEFLEACKAHLAEGGTVVANLWEAEADYHNMVKTYDAVFPEWHVVRCEGSTNAIVTAFPDKRGLTAEKWMDLADRFDKENKLGLELKKLVDRGFQASPRVPTDAKVLLDKDKPKE